MGIWIFVSLAAVCNLAYVCVRCILWLHIFRHNNKVKSARGAHVHFRFEVQIHPLQLCHRTTMIRQAGRLLRKWTSVRAARPSSFSRGHRSCHSWRPAGSTDFGLSHCAVTRLQVQTRWALFPTMETAVTIYTNNCSHKTKLQNSRSESKNLDPEPCVIHVCRCRRDRSHV